jgi:hypothetical protein
MKLLTLVFTKSGGKIQQHTNIKFPVFKAFVKLYREMVKKGIQNNFT